MSKFWSGWVRTLTYCANTDANKPTKMFREVTIFVPVLNRLFNKLFIINKRK